MGKTSKGFGELLKLERKKGKKSAKPEPKITILRTDEDEDDELYFESNFEEQEQRIGAIVGLDEDGEVFRR